MATFSDVALFLLMSYCIVKEAQMGLDSNGIKFLLFARKLGVDFSETAMIGRQILFSLDPSYLKQIFLKFGYPIDDETSAGILSRNESYSEELFRCFGAKEIDSFDYTSYEKATHIHDMNFPISDQFKNKYSVLLDGGALEHIFNFPIAIRNCMEMVKVSGYYLSITPTNNFSGHGFYQFSPELFFSIFTEENGFKLVHVITFEDRYDAEWFSVKSPTAVRSRVTLMNDKPTYLLIIAKKLKECKIFETTPQQSDYVTAWAGAITSAQIKVKHQRSPLKELSRKISTLPLKFLRTKVPYSLRVPISRVTTVFKPSFKSNFFEPIDPLVYNSKASLPK